MHDIGWQDLDGNVPSQAMVSGPVHLTHSAGAEYSHDFVSAELVAGIQRGSRRRRHAEPRDCRRFEKIAGGSVTGEQRPDSRRQRSIALTCLSDERLTLLRRAAQCLVKR
jgi:hypothetical protein